MKLHATYEDEAFSAPVLRRRVFVFFVFFFHSFFLIYVEGDLKFRLHFFRLFASSFFWRLPTFMILNERQYTPHAARPRSRRRKENTSSQSPSFNDSPRPKTESMSLSCPSFAHSSLTWPPFSGKTKEKKRRKQPKRRRLTQNNAASSTTLFAPPAQSPGN